MTKIFVTETFARAYELEVPDLDTDTVIAAIEAYHAQSMDEPTWAGTYVTGEQGSEVLDY